MTGRAAVAVTAAALALWFVSWVLLHQGFWHAHQLVDTPIYEQYADAMWSGRVPYRDFAVEYPPAALPVFLAPRLSAAAGDFGAYNRAYENWAAGIGAAMLLGAAAALAALRPRLWAAAAALGLIAVSPLLLGNVVLTRFDFWPAALAVGALAALLWGRDLLGALLFALAVAAKLWPAVLVPLAVVWIWRRRGARAAARWSVVTVAATAAIFLPFAILSPGGLAHSFSTQLSRPLQVESLGSAILIAAHHVAGLDVAINSAHGSQNLVANGTTWAAAVSTGLQLALLGTVWAAFARGPATPERLVAAAAAAVAVFVGFGKVFSPQYLVWLVPLVPLVRGRRGAVASVLLAAALVLTQLWFPDRYWQLALNFRPFPSWVLLARDLTVAALALVLTASLLEDQRLGERRAAREPVERVRREVEVGPA
jgi:hypothetical protein